MDIIMFFMSKIYGFDWMFSSLIIMYGIIILF